MSSSDESSSEDENWAALQSVAVSGLELVSQSQDIADKALKEASRRRAKSQGRLDTDNIQSDAAGNDEALDPIQQKIAAMLNARLAASMGEGDLGIDAGRIGGKKGKEEKRKKKEGKVKAGSSAAENDNTSLATDAECLMDSDGMRLFKRVPKGTPVILKTNVPEEAAGAHQQSQAGTLATDRILAGTRYSRDDKQVEHCLNVLGSEADPMVRAAEEDVAQKKRDKAAAKVARKEAAAAQLATKAASQSRIEESGGGIGSGMDVAKQEKKKRKKKAKIEGIVIEDGKLFVPHEQRMAVLTGSNLKY